MSSSNTIYLQFNSIISEQQEKTKNLNKKISGYKEKIISGENTISLEKEIENQISSLKEAHRELENAYSNKNAPSQISPNELDRRQKQIQNLGSDIQDIEQNYKQIKNKKYEYKGSKIDNYQPTEEMKTMSNSELLQYQQQKMKKQDDQIDDIILDVKKGTVLAKETEKILDDQNKQLDELQEDIDKLDSKLKKGAKRFADYAAKKSGYCIVIILVLELIAGILFITLIK